MNRLLTNVPVYLCAFYCVEFYVILKKTNLLQQIKKQNYYTSVVAQPFYANAVDVFCIKLNLDLNHYKFIFSCK